ncbi:enoyl-CoA hydratase/isomerase family protein [Dietzia sp.]|uniref:enoyl-CoA hydratase/isomerase family protein n=1 Tax=Dietzia sp. TaxID=1871616 RepID=UPI002FD9CED1
MPTLEQNESVYILRFSTPENVDEAPDNVFSPDFLDSIESCLDTLEAAEGPAALVTIGAGKFYSNGLDVEYGFRDAETLNPYIERVHRMFARFLELPMPTVAAINGHAFGAGAMLSLCHDMRIMRTGRGFWCLPEAARGMPFPPGMNALVTGSLPPQTARLAMLTSQRFGAEDALAAGIVDAVAEESALLDEATQRATAATLLDGKNLKGIRAGIHANTLAALALPQE